MSAERTSISKLIEGLKGEPLVEGGIIERLVEQLEEHLRVNGDAVVVNIGITLTLKDPKDGQAQ
jgi:hypothetical protein